VLSRFLPLVKFLKFALALDRTSNSPCLYLYIFKDLALTQLEAGKRGPLMYSLVSLVFETDCNKRNNNALMIHHRE